jgi:hypothetical protein
MAKAPWLSSRLLAASSELVPMPISPSSFMQIQISMFSMALILSLRPTRQEGCNRSVF